MGGVKMKGQRGLASEHPAGEVRVRRVREPGVPHPDQDPRAVESESLDRVHVRGQAHTVVRHDSVPRGALDPAHVVALRELDHGGRRETDVQHSELRSLRANLPPEAPDRLAGGGERCVAEDLHAHVERGVPAFQRLPQRRLDPVARPQLPRFQDVRRKAPRADRLRL